MGLNKWKGRIPNSIKEEAKEQVDKYGSMSYHYACYDTGFGESPAFVSKEEWNESQEYHFRLIDCIVKELKQRKLW